ncbi:MAG: hypothetical protein HY334_05420, partial [Armatimonadetes bacterium]|nr:hypothetical protein [Armatimonadota bacterium]
AAAAALAGGAAAAVSAWAGGRLGGEAVDTALLLTGAGSLGVAIFLAAAWLLGVEEVRAVRDLLLRRLPPGAV